MAARRPAALVAGITVLVALAAGGCAGSHGRGHGRAAPAQSPAVDSFRSTRTYQAVAVPVRLRIPAARVNTGLERLGRAADGTIALPSRPGVAGWYAAGPRPGQPGPAVVIGHVDWDNGPAVFFYLAELRAGATVYVDRADGSTIQFRTTGLTSVPKSHFPTDLVYGPSLQPSLRLVTCGGSFDHATRNYRDNVIIFAVPA